jgi:hypothetical protein
MVVLDLRAEALEVAARAVQMAPGRTAVMDLAAQPQADLAGARRTTAARAAQPHLPLAAQAETTVAAQAAALVD